MIFIENFEDYDQSKKLKMIADMLSNKTPDPTVTELFIRSKKLNISIFLSHSAILL